MAITPNDFSKIWASNADTPEYTFSEADYLKGWDFVGNLPPTRAQWNAMQKSTDEKMKYVFDNFGAPLTASTVAEMTMRNRVYVYTGSETGYTAGHWYYWNGSAWTDGGVYNSNTVQVDPTLTISGAAADSLHTGLVKQSVVESNKGIENFSLYAFFVNGGLANGVLTTYAKYRVATNDIIALNKDITISVATGFKYGIHYFESRVFSSDSGWLTGTTSIASDKTFKIVIARTTENTSEVANILEFISAVTFATTIAEEVGVVTDKLNQVTEPSRNINTSNVGRYQISSSGTIFAGSVNNFGMESIVPCKPNTKYTCSVHNTTPSTGLAYYVFYYNSSKEFLSRDRTATVTTPNDARYICIFVYNSGGITIDSTSRIQIEEGQTATAYCSPTTAVDSTARLDASIAMQNTDYGAKASTSLLFNTITKKRYMYHIGVTTHTNVIVPSQSLADVWKAKRLGFDVMEFNVQKTSDNKYVCMHGTGGNFGLDFYSLDSTDITNVAISSVTLSYIQNYVRYNSIYEKYRVAPPTLEQALYECKKANMTPMITYVDDNVVELADKIIGKNSYILNVYNGNRPAGYDGVCASWLDIADATALVEKCDASGGAYIAGLNVTNAVYSGFTKDDWKDLFNAVHEAGYRVNHAYGDMSMAIMLQEAGEDNDVTLWRINEIENGNLCNLVNDVTFADYTTTGTVSNGNIVLATNDTVQPSVSMPPVPLGGGSLHIRFNGSIKLSMGPAYTSAYTFTSDGLQDMWFSTFFEEASPTFTITAASATTIYELTYKASIM